ncbi:hypothetical protein AM2010_543 [Pelagerythrobacter marensis]|uniref:Uncharacterized protein n=2 Tax=Pelagerythrobacter marensis TaxID=543877 RepID=A0A0G3X539_9SPHN|nr:hypothetical protein AM2010_543 [Pelagerythrobacter marensis]
MTVHFAASRSAEHSPLARILRRPALMKPANDNCLARSDDRMLHAALRHFARHGLGAAREARRQAEHAFFAGDREMYDWWHEICRTLDARLARGLDRTTRAGIRRPDASEKPSAIPAP